MLISYPGGLITAFIMAALLFHDCDAGRPHRGLAGDNPGYIPDNEVTTFTPTAVINTTRLLMPTLVTVALLTDPNAAQTPEPKSQSTTDIGTPPIWMTNSEGTATPTGPTPLPTSATTLYTLDISTPSPVASIPSTNTTAYNTNHALSIACPSWVMIAASAFVVVVVAST